MYVKYGYYNNNFKGTVIPKEDFQRSEQEAETYIRYLTYLDGDIFADEAHTDPVIADAVCAAAEAYYTATMEQQQGGNVKSENKDGMSVSFVVARKVGETGVQGQGRTAHEVFPHGNQGRVLSGSKRGHDCQ